MNALRLFCDVAALRSMSRAAKRHDITQSAVSQRIRQLEAQLGAPLIDRSVRPFALTDAGELLLREGRELLERYQRLTERVRGLGAPADLRGEVRVCASYSAGIGLLRALRHRFMQQAPAVEVALEYQRPEDVALSVQQGRCDFGIVSYPRTWPGTAMNPRRNERMAVVCAPHHPLADNRSVTAPQLAAHSMVGFEPELPVSRAIVRYLRAHGVRPHIGETFDNIDTIKSAVAGGGAIAILPLRAALREREAGALRIVELLPRLERPLGIIYPRGSTLSAAAARFADFLERHAGPVDEGSPAELVDPRHPHSTRSAGGQGR